MRWNIARTPTTPVMMKEKKTMKYAKCTIIYLFSYLTLFINDQLKDDNPTATKRNTETQSKISWTAINVADKQRQTTTAVEANKQ